MAHPVNVTYLCNAVRPDDVVVGSGGFHFTHEPIRISTLLGSCVAFTAWHPRRRIGGLCHYLLPSAPPGPVPPDRKRGMYAVGAAELFQEAFLAAGSHVSEYVVRMFGGGNMFPQQTLGRPCQLICIPESPPTACRDVGCRNVLQGRLIFEALGFAIRIEDVGGAFSRQIVFDVRTGDVWVKRTAPIVTAEA